MPRKRKYTRVKYKKDILKQTYNSKRPVTNLKPVNPKHKYSNTSSYIKSVYAANKEYIDSNIDTFQIEKFGSGEKAFRNIVRDKMKEINPKTGEKYKVKEAIKTLTNSKLLHADWTNKDVHANNFYELLKKDKNVYREFRNLTRKNGRFTSYDYSKLEFEGYYNYNGQSYAVYSYGDVYILERESPKAGAGASVIILSKEDFTNSEGKNLFFEKKTKRKQR